MYSPEDEYALDSLIQSLSAPQDNSIPIEKGTTPGSVLQQMAMGNAMYSDLPAQADQPSSRNVRVASPTKNRGIPLYTNVQSVKDANPNAIFINSSVNNTPTDLSTGLVQGLTTQMDAIQAEKDPLKRNADYLSLKDSVAASNATLAKESRILAENKVGIPRMEQTLSQMEMVDKLQPGWVADSKEVTNLRNQILKAKDVATNLSAQMISENPTIAGMNSRVNSFMKEQEFLIKQDLTRKEKDEDYIETQAQTISPETTNILTQLRPDLGNDPKKVARLKIAAFRSGDKSLIPFFQEGFSEQHVVPLALEGNIPALKLAKSIQEARTKEPRERVEKDLNTMNKVVNEETFFLDTMLESGKNDPTIRTKLSEYTAYSMTAPKDKTGEATKKGMRLAMANEWISSQKSNILMNNVEGWIGDSNPEITSIIDGIKTVNGNKPVGVKELISAYVTKVPAKERAIRFEEIKQQAIKAAEKQNKGLYGHINLIGLNNRLKASYGMADFDVDSADINPMARSMMMTF